MKVIVFLAVLGVCYTIDYNCNVGDTWAKKASTKCPAIDSNDKAICSRPAYMDVRDNKYTAYACGACDKSKTDKECVTCTNVGTSQTTLDTPCNTESKPMHAYECPAFEMKQGASEWTEKAAKDKCTVALAPKVEEVAASEACFKPVDGYKKPATGVTTEEDTAFQKGGCGKCADVGNAELKKPANCMDYTAGAATMSFMLAPLLAVLFWLH